MKVKELIESLSKYDPELEVQAFSDIGPLISEPTLFRGRYEDPDNNKCIYVWKHGLFVGFGNPNDYELDHEVYEVMEH
jgi:hypothetical protein